MYTHLDFADFVRGTRMPNAKIASTSSVAAMSARAEPALSKTKKKTNMLIHTTVTTTKTKSSVMTH